MPLSGGELRRRGARQTVRRSARELEIADLLAFIKTRGRAQHGMDHRRHALHGGALLRSPTARSFRISSRFWEFISGPLHAGTWGPGDLDNTFGPQVRYQNGCSLAQGENLAPCFGLQFYGLIEVDGATEAMTVTLKDVGGK